MEYETENDLKIAVEKIDQRDYRGNTVGCVAEVCASPALYLIFDPKITRFSQLVLAVGIASGLVRLHHAAGVDRPADTMIITTAVHLHLVVIVLVATAIAPHPHSVVMHTTSVIEATDETTHLAHRVPVDHQLMITVHRVVSPTTRMPVQRRHEITTRDPHLDMEDKNRTETAEDHHTRIVDIHLVVGLHHLNATTTMGTNVAVVEAAAVPATTGNFFQFSCTQSMRSCQLLTCIDSSVDGDSCS